MAGYGWISQEVEQDLQTDVDELEAERARRHQRRRFFAEARAAMLSREERRVRERAAAIEELGRLHFWLLGALYLSLVWLLHACGYRFPGWRRRV